MNPEVALNEREDVKEALALFQKSLLSSGCYQTAAELIKKEEKRYALIIRQVIGQDLQMALGFDEGENKLWIAPTLTPRTDHNTNTYITDGSFDNNLVVVKKGDNGLFETTIEPNHPVARLLYLLKTVNAPDTLKAKLLGDSNHWSTRDAPDVVFKDDRSLVINSGKGAAKIAIDLEGNHFQTANLDNGQWTVNRKQSFNYLIRT